MLTKTDNELAELIKEGDNDAFVEMKRRHHALCTKMSAKFIPILTNIGYSTNDIEQEKDLAMHRACRTFKTGDNKSKVHTWIANNVRYRFLTICKTLNDHNRMEEYIPDKQTHLVEEFNCDGDLSNFVSKTLDELSDKRIKKTFIDRTINYKNITDIAKELQVSPTAIRNWYSIGQKYIQSKLGETKVTSYNINHQHA